MVYMLYICYMKTIQKQLSIDRELHGKAVEKAKSLGLNLSAYIRLLISQDLQKGENK